MDRIDHDGVQEPHQDVQDGENDRSSNSIGHEDYHPILIGEWNLPRVSLGIRIFILISIGEKTIIDSHWFMKDEGAIDWREGFPTSIGQAEQSQGRVLEAYQGERGVSCVLWKEKEEKESMEKRLVFMWEKVLFMKRKICANKSMEGSCV
jgi:hypothetical protein